MNESEIQRAWEKFQRNFVIELLKIHKPFQEIMEMLSGFQKAFSSEPDTLACCDERVQLDTGIKIGIAGALSLGLNDETNVFVKNHKGRIRTVTSHNGCGAAAIAYQERIKRRLPIPDGIINGDDLGAAHARKMAKMLDAKCYHISADKMTGELHDARGICFDGTGRFNPAAIRDLPPVFLSSSPGFGLSEEYCKIELQILCGIAFSNHGFGDRFTPSDPFYVFASASDNNRLNELKEWARAATSRFNGRVAIDGFAAPKIGS
jgi:hypothetical protein